MQVREPLKLAISMTFFYWLALWMSWDLPQYGALAMILVSLGTTGASLQKGVYRIVGTTAGLGVGLFALAVFAQDRWASLAFYAGYIAVMGYFMQGSRAPYAWFVAGFLPVLLWSSTYGKVDSAFHYCIFRYFETTAGVVIYTLVSLLLWRRSAGDELGQQGADLWTGLGELLAFECGRLTGAEAADATGPPRARLAGQLAQLNATLQSAYYDTASVTDRKEPWEAFRRNVRVFGDALALCGECVDDCRHLHSCRVVPGLETGLASLRGRLDRIRTLWPEAVDAAGDAAGAQPDADLFEPLQLTPDSAAAAELSHFDRAVIMSLVQQLEILDASSRELLRTMRVLSGLARERDDRPAALPPDLDRPPRWVPERLLNACFPALCFVVAFLLWTLINPPAGPAMANLAGTIGLSLLLNWMNPLSVLVLLLAVMVIVVAPLYFFVMPGLDNGFALLAFIFAFTLLFGVLGSRKPVLKTIPLVVFFMMAGISNQQSYSFPGLADGGVMLILGLGVVAVVQMLVSPMRPEQRLLSGLRRFFRGGARIVGPDGRDRGRHQAAIMSLPRRMQAIVKSLDFRVSPADTPEKMQRLLDTLASMAYRFQALEIARARLAGRPGLPSTEPIVAQTGRLRELAEHVFDRWARFDHAPSVDRRDAAERLSRDLHESLESMTRPESRVTLDDGTVRDLYALLGAARGLIGAMAETNIAMSAISWDRWTEDRFP